MANPISFQTLSASKTTSQIPIMPDSNNYLLQWSFCQAQVKQIDSNPGQTYFKTTISNCLMKMIFSIWIGIMAFPILYLLIFHLRGKTFRKGIRSVKTWILLFMLFVDLHLFQKMFFVQSIVNQLLNNVDLSEEQCILAYMTLQFVFQKASRRLITQKQWIKSINRLFILSLVISTLCVITVIFQEFLGIDSLERKLVKELFPDEPILSARESLVWCSSIFKLLCPISLFIMIFFFYIQVIKFENHQKVGDLEDTMKEDYTQEDVIATQKKTVILKLIVKVFLITSFIEAIQAIITNFQANDYIDNRTFEKTNAVCNVFTSNTTLDTWLWFLAMINRYLINQIAIVYVFWPSKEKIEKKRQQIRIMKHENQGVLLEGQESNATNEVYEDLTKGNREKQNSNEKIKRPQNQQAHIAFQDSESFSSVMQSSVSAITASEVDINSNKKQKNKYQKLDDMKSRKSGRIKLKNEGSESSEEETKSIHSDSS